MCNIQRLRVPRSVVWCLLPPTACWSNGLHVPAFALCYLLPSGGLLYSKRRSGSTGHIPDEGAVPPNLRGAACLRQAPPAVGGVNYGGQEGVPRGAGVCGAHEHPRRHPGEAAAAPRADARVRAFLAAGVTRRSRYRSVMLECTKFKREFVAL